jgi:hypothetical protein
MHPWDLIWIFFILSSLQPVVQRRLLALSRRQMLARIAARREATVITLLHRQETISFLGIPFMRHIDIDDAQTVLAAIRETPPGRGIELILHTPAGLVLAASQIAQALHDHDDKVTAVVPHYAMSRGTLIALAADVWRPSLAATSTREAAAYWPKLRIDGPERRVAVDDDLGHEPNGIRARVATEAGAPAGSRDPSSRADGPKTPRLIQGTSTSPALSIRKVSRGANPARSKPDRRAHGRRSGID